jgi:uncharacterized SAM-binding protein YcdF (DUF218 family)
MENEESIDRGFRRLGRVRFWALTALAVAVFAGVLIKWGGDLLVVSEALPANAEVAVMMDGRGNALSARLAEAMRLLRQGRVEHVMISVPKFDAWDDYIPDVAHEYLESQYGASLTARVALVSLPPTAVSQGEEAIEFGHFLEDRNWRSVIVVTSNYNTRRARLEWRQAVAKASPPFQVWIDGVEDGDFERGRWWRQRRYAKTWVEETGNLLWTELFGAAAD